MHRSTFSSTCGAWASRMGLCALSIQATLSWAAPQFPDQDIVCSFNDTREQQRQASARNFAEPVAEQMLINDMLAWTAGSSAKPILKPGDKVTLIGLGFGAGTDTRVA